MKTMRSDISRYSYCGGPAVLRDLPENQPEGRSLRL
jgi:hypothetical protein